MTVHVEVTEQEIQEVKAALADIVEHPFLKSVLSEGVLEDVVVRANYVYKGVKAIVSVSSRK